MEKHIYIAQKLYDSTFIHFRLDERINIFLIGKALADRSGLRHRLRDELERTTYWRKRHLIHYPEEIFSDLLFDKSIDLLTLENILAKSVSVIVVCLESPGAIAELGAFVNNADLRRRILVIANDKHRMAKSFIRTGPLRLLETDVGKNSIIWYPYSNGDIVDLGSKVKERIKEIHKGYVENPGLESPIVAAKFILALVSILSPVEQSTMEECISYLVPDREEVAPIVLRSALNNLFNQKAIVLVNNMYVVTPSGYVLLDKMLPTTPLKRGTAKKQIDHLRCEYMNYILRGKNRWAIGV